MYRITNKNKQTQGEKAEESWKQVTTKLVAKEVVMSNTSQVMQMNNGFESLVTLEEYQVKDMPILCMGDFNAMLNETDRLNGSPVQEGEIKDFVDFLPDTHMIELKKNGSDYTWKNGHTCSRIDRAIVNAKWMTHMSMLEVMILTPGISDHSILSLELGGVKVHTQEDIEREVTRFYKELLGKSAPCQPNVNVNIMKLGNVLNREQQLLLA
ncbi:hypothetical protein BC332_27888 [Capsicum chinense]|nr:hypothetical protein BC332_27888 [Capsicum chinense]